MDGQDFYRSLGLKPVVNAAGRMTALGVSTPSPFVLEAMNAAASAYVDVEELYDAADRAIARATGAEAGFITSCAAAGIAIAVAACVSRGDRARAEALPGPVGPPDEVVLQKAHAIHFGAALTQMIRLGGGTPVEVGAVNRVLPHQLAAAFGPRAAALMIAVSHHAGAEGALPLAEAIALAGAAHVPVIVDAAAELDLHKYIAAGADLVIYSGHKGVGAPTSGIVAGRRDLIAWCRLQNVGVGRAMKIGKESIVGCLAALDEQARGGPPAAPAELDALEAALAGLPGLTTSRAADPTRPEIVRLRLHLDPARAGLDARALLKRLAAGTPAVYLRGHGASAGTLEVDFRPLAPGEAARIGDAVRAILEEGQADD